MQITASVPKLSERAKEQLASLGFDVAIGYQRLRAINASRNRIQAENQLQRDQVASLDGRLADAVKRGASEHSSSLNELRAELAACTSRVGEADARIAVLNRERATVKAWHSSCARTLSRALEALGGFKDISQVLPDFDTGADIDLEAYRENVLSQAAGARSFGGRR